MSFEHHTHLDTKDPHHQRVVEVGRKRLPCSEDLQHQLHVSKSVLIMLIMIMMVLIEVGLEVEPRLDELHVSKSVLKS